MAALIKKLWNDESGATLVEYAMIVGLIIAVVIGAMAVFGTGVDALFTKVTTKAANSIN